MAKKRTADPQATAYRDFLLNHRYRWCWFCGRDERQRPTGWWSPWILHKAHLGTGSGSMHRVEDVRAVVIACPLCHNLHCGLDTKRVNGEEYPCLSNANALWAKQVMDPQNWDPKFVASVWVGKPPDPAPLPEFFKLSYQKLRGIRPIQTSL